MEDTAGYMYSKGRDPNALMKAPAAVGTVGGPVVVPRANARAFSNLPHGGTPVEDQEGRTTPVSIFDGLALQQKPNLVNVITNYVMDQSAEVQDVSNSMVGAAAAAANVPAPPPVTHEEITKNMGASPSAAATVSQSQQLQKTVLTNAKNFVFGHAENFLPRRS
jgi:hypothetical protein